MKNCRIIVEGCGQCELTELADIYARLQEICGRRIYHTHHIPERKKDLACWSYAADVTLKENIIALVDNTFWGTAEYGCFFTASRFYSRDRKFGIKRSGISAETHFSVEKKQLIINGEPFISFPRSRTAHFRKLAEVLNLLAAWRTANDASEQL